MFAKIKRMGNEQLEAEVTTCSSNESKTSHAVAANLSEPNLKIPLDKNGREIIIHRSNRKNNLYNALVEDYESDKLILETYGETVTFKRRREDEDKDEEPSAGLNRGSKRRRAGKEPESTSAPKEKTTKPSGKSNEGSKSSHKSADHKNLNIHESQYHWIPNSVAAIRPLDHFIINDLEYLMWFSSRKNATQSRNSKAADDGTSKESARDVYSKRRIIAVTKLEIVEWQNYKHTGFGYFARFLTNLLLKSKSAWTEKDQIDNFLKERRLMRSLEKVVGGRLYEGDLRLLQRTI
ncbi:hypothetical protein Tco_0241532 [Tanacetum coccineum]